MKVLKVLLVCRELQVTLAQMAHKVLLELMELTELKELRAL